MFLCLLLAAWFPIKLPLKCRKCYLRQPNFAPWDPPYKLMPTVLPCLHLWHSNIPTQSKILATALKAGISVIFPGFDCII